MSGVRHDVVAKAFPIVTEEQKPEFAKGKYIEPKAFGKGDDFAIYPPPDPERNRQAEK